MNDTRHAYRSRLGLAVLAVACCGLVGGTTALASTTSTSAPTSAARDQYHKPPKVAPATVVKSATTTQPKASSSGTLPFTGVSLIWPAVGAVLLVGLGLGLRRHERRNLRN